MTAYKKYPRYKNSGVEWLGDVPEHWESALLGRHLARNDSGEWGDDVENDQDSTLVLRSSDQTVDGVLSVQNAARRQLSVKAQSQTRLYSGDLLITKSSGSQLHIGKTSLINREVEELQCGFSNFMQRLSFKRTVLPFYGWFWVNSPLARFHFKQSAQTTTGLANLNASLISAMPFLTPPLAEQHAIAEYLDRETAALDALIEKKERLMELLEEKRQALISHAVTKGLNPNAPMKDSGVQWLGEVPAHWEVKRLSHISAFAGGGTPSKDNLEYWNGDIPWVSPKDMKSDWLVDTKDHVSALGVKESSTNIIPAETPVIVTRSGILRHTLPIAILTTPMAVNQDIKAFLLSRRKILPEFFLRWVQGLNKFLLFNWTKEGPTVESVEHSYVVRTLIPLPSLTEQQKIVRHLQSQLTKVDNILTTTRRSIDLLKEKRSALITAVVTGQVDVRDEVAGLRLKRG